MIAEVTERWNPYARIRQDFAGFADIIAFSPDLGIVAVQTTSGSNVNARIKKIVASEKAHAWVKSGGTILLHGWAKKGPRGKAKRWTLREEVLIP